jgi:hypothetical protein
VIVALSFDVCVGEQENCEDNNDDIPAREDQPIEDQPKDDRVNRVLT